MHRAWTIALRQLQETQYSVPELDRTLLDAEQARVKIVKAVGVGTVQQDFAVGKADGAETLRRYAEKRVGKPEHKRRQGRKYLLPTGNRRTLSRDLGDGQK